MSVLSNLPESLVNESGGGFGFVCIWRKKEDDPQKEQYYVWKGAVGEFLLKEENQNGAWLIDGGWGGPPGPIKVVWNSGLQKWINKGFPPH